MTTRSTVGWLVYGSDGWSSVGASEASSTTGDGDGVAVTPLTKPLSVEPTPPTTDPEAAGPDVQDARPEREDARDERDPEDPRQAAAALDRSVAGEPGASPGRAA